MPIPTEEIEAKFRAHAALAIGRAEVHATVRALGRLERLPEVASLTALWAGRAWA